MGGAAKPEPEIDLPQFVERRVVGSAVSRGGQKMAREKPLDLAVVQTWLAAWDKSDLFSDAAIQHLQSLIRDTHCIVVVTLGMGREPHSRVFRRRKYVSPATLGRSSSPIIVPSTSKSTALESPTDVPRRSPLKSTDLIVLAVDIAQNSSMFVGPVAPSAPPIGQLWHQIGVKLERVLRWDGAEWVIAGHLIDSPTIFMQGQIRPFMQALAIAHWGATLLDCEFIYTYDGSTWGNA
jgi:hypothetical protein